MRIVSRLGSDVIIIRLCRLLKAVTRGVSLSPVVTCGRGLPFWWCFIRMHAACENGVMYHNAPRIHNTAYFLCFEIRRFSLPPN